ncbi:hypothetical protein JCM10212_000563 [Sporobolomyces blumeae]
MVLVRSDSTSSQWFEPAWLDPDAGSTLAHQLDSTDQRRVRHLASISIRNLSLDPRLDSIHTALLGRPGVLPLSSNPLSNETSSDDDDDDDDHQDNHLVDSIELGPSSTSSTTETATGNHATTTRARPKRSASAGTLLSKHHEIREEEGSGPDDEERDSSGLSANLARTSTSTTTTSARQAVSSSDGSVRRHRSTSRASVTSTGTSGSTSTVRQAPRLPSVPPRERLASNDGNDPSTLFSSSSSHANGSARTGRASTTTTTTTTTTTRRLGGTTSSRYAKREEKRRRDAVERRVVDSFVSLELLPPRRRATTLASVSDPRQAVAMTAGSTSRSSTTWNAMPLPTIESVPAGSVDRVDLAVASRIASTETTTGSTRDRIRLRRRAVSSSYVPSFSGSSFSNRVTKRGGINGARRTDERDRAGRTRGDDEGDLCRDREDKGKGREDLDPEREQRRQTRPRPFYVSAPARGTMHPSFTVDSAEFFVPDRRTSSSSSSTIDRTDITSSSASAPRPTTSLDPDLITPGEVDARLGGGHVRGDLRLRDDPELRFWPGLRHDRIRVKVFARPSCPPPLPPPVAARSNGDEKEGRGGSKVTGDGRDEGDERGWKALVEWDVEMGGLVSLGRDPTKFPSLPPNTILFALSSPPCPFVSSLPTLSSGRSSAAAPRTASAGSPNGPADLEYFTAPLAQLHRATPGVRHREKRMRKRTTRQRHWADGLRQSWSDDEGSCSSDDEDPYASDRENGNPLADGGIRGGAVRRRRGGRLRVERFDLDEGNVSDPGFDSQGAVVGARDDAYGSGPIRGSWRARARSGTTTSLGRPFDRFGRERRARVDLERSLARTDVARGQENERDRDDGRHRGRGEGGWTDRVVSIEEDRRRRLEVVERSRRETRMVELASRRTVERLWIGEREIGQARGETDQVRARLDEKESTRLSELGREREEREDKVQDLEGVLEAVEEEVEEARRDNRLRRDRLRERRGRLEKVQEEMEEKKRELERLEVGLREQEQTLSSLRGSIVSRRTHLITLLSHLFPIDPVLPTDSAPSPPPLLFSIVSLPLPNSTYPSSLGDETLASALGLAALVVQSLSRYLAVPLCYPIEWRNSRSLIRDEISMMRGSRNFPLFRKGVEGYRFEYAVFLLNKDIEQLMYSQNLTVLDLRNTLPNLKTLILSLSYDEGHEAFRDATLEPESTFVAGAGGDRSRASLERDTLGRHDFDESGSARTVEGPDDNEPRIEHDDAHTQEPPSETAFDSSSACSIRSNGTGPTDASRSRSSSLASTIRPPASSSPGSSAMSPHDADADTEPVGASARMKRSASRDSKSSTSTGSTARAGSARPGKGTRTASNGLSCEKERSGSPLPAVEANGSSSASSVEAATETVDPTATGMVKVEEAKPRGRERHKRSRTASDTLSATPSGSPSYGSRIANGLWSAVAGKTAVDRTPHSTTIDRHTVDDERDGHAGS